VEILKKASAFFARGLAVIQTLIHRLEEKAHIKAPVTRLCALLGASRAGVYAARQRQQRPRPPCAARAAVRAAFEASGRCYGSRRIRAALCAQGQPIPRHRVRRIMRGEALTVRWRRKFVHTTDSRHALPVAENVLNRQFTPSAPNRAWVCDITYVRTETGWLYLAAVLDLYSRKVVGWDTAEAMPAELVCTALQRALDLRKPAPGLIVHCDRGSQYASAQHQQLLARYGLIASMSRKGNCWDNAVMERFFLNLKMEERLWHRKYANPMEATREINHYIVGFYNTRRSALNYQSPVEFENNASSL